MNKFLMYGFLLIYSMGMLSNNENNLENNENQNSSSNPSISLSLEELNQIKDRDNLLTLVLMVKDEEPVVVSTLKTYVESGINYVLLYDTGSTDKTIEVAEQYLKETNTNYFIRQEPFVNFAVSRNKGLRLAEELFPDNKFMVMPDTEWYLNGGEDLLKFCRDNINGDDMCYMIKIINDNTDFGMPRLFRSKRNVKFAGVCHEVPSCGSRIYLPSNIFFKLTISSFGAEKSMKRWHRDKDLLLEEFMKNPGCSRTAFYLAQTYHCLGDFKEAYKFYKYRSKMVGWPEEDYMAMYRLAQVAEQMPKEDGEDNWPEALNYYLEAYSMRPNRVEPLIKIARHYVTDKFPLAYLFSKKACEVPYPAQDVLFIDKHLYDYDRHDILGLCCWYLGNFEEGDAAVQEALKARPDYPHLQRNKKLYEDKLKEIEDIKEQFKKDLDSLKQ